MDTIDAGSPGILQSAGPALGPGGQQIFLDAQVRLWVAYHAWTAPETSYSDGGSRAMRIDRVSFVAACRASEGPTTAPQPL